MIFPGALIVREAGGCILSVDGSEFDLMSRGIVAAATEELAREVCASVKVYDPGMRDFEERCPI